jgi:hypothetical protein
VLTFMIFAFALRIPELQVIVGKVSNRLPSSIQRLLGRIGFV